jgi:hypothetical protein
MVPKRETLIDMWKFPENGVLGNFEGTYGNSTFREPSQPDLGSSFQIRKLFNDGRTKLDADEVSGCLRRILCVR